MKWLSTNRCIGQSYESIFTEIEENLTFTSTQAYKWGVRLETRRIGLSTAAPIFRRMLL